MKTNQAKQNAVAFVVGLIFAVGLVISGMTQPQKIIAFLDPWNWDPSLLFVMVGAVSVHALMYPLVRRRKSPLFDTHWHVPNRQDLTSRLVIGSALFGMGWGLGGYCPGPGITSLAAFDIRTVAFVGAMLAGMILFKKTEPHLGLKE